MAFRFPDQTVVVDLPEFVTADSNAFSFGCLHYLPKPESFYPAREWQSVAIVLLVTALVLSQLVAQSESSKLTFDELKVKAESRDAAAQCQLGVHYVRGDGVPKDYA
jgi:hypothetical protein